MIKIYKKIEKSKECPTGYLDVTDSITDKPFLFCISAQDNHDKSIFGTIRVGAEASRLYTFQSDGAFYKTNEFPIAFLGIRFVKDEKYNNVSDELVDRFILPYLVSNGTSLDCLCRRARMMNFMTYCDGTQTFLNIEEVLKNRLLGLGMNLDDVKIIISNMHLVGVGTMVDTKESDATCISLIDINDDEILTEESYQTREDMLNRNVSYLRYGINDNVGLFYYLGSGDHSLKEYLKNGVYIKPYFHFIISKILESSLNGREYCIEDILNDIEAFFQNGFDEEDGLKFIDDSNYFPSAPKYSEGELKLRKELDQLYKSYAIECEKRVMFERSTAGYRDNQGKIVSNIKKYSSDMTFLQILCDIGLWQTPGSIDPYQYPSDREIRSKTENNDNKFHM